MFVSACVSVWRSIGSTHCSHCAFFRSFPFQLLAHYIIASCARYCLLALLSAPMCECVCVCSSTSFPAINSPRKTTIDDDCAMCGEGVARDRLTADAIVKKNAMEYSPVYRHRHIVCQMVERECDSLCHAAEWRSRAKPSKLYNFCCGAAHFKWHPS